MRYTPNDSRLAYELLFNSRRHPPHIVETIWDTKAECYLTVTIPYRGYTTEEGLRALNWRSSDNNRRRFKKAVGPADHSSGARKIALASGFWIPLASGTGRYLLTNDPDPVRRAADYAANQAETWTKHRNRHNAKANEFAPTEAPLTPIEQLMKAALEQSGER
jgi:hypothetical protein